MSLKYLFNLNDFVDDTILTKQIGTLAWELFCYGIPIIQSNLFWPFFITYLSIFFCEMKENEENEEKFLIVSKMGLLSLESAMG